MKSGERGAANRQRTSAAQAIALALSEPSTPRIGRTPYVAHSPFPVPQGFTLFEMLAVILLIAIAATAATISVTQGLSSARANAASSEMAASLRATRAQAIVRNTTEVFEVDTRAASYRGADGHQIKLPDDMQLGITSAKEDQPNNHTGRIRFFADGSATGGRVTLKRGQREWHVNVSWLTGAVSVVMQ